MPFTLIAVTLAALLSEAGAPFDATTIFNTLLGTSPVAGILFWQLVLEQKDVKALRQTVDESHRREIEQAERLAPLLERATYLLKEASVGFEATIERGRRTADPAAEVIAQLERVLRDLEERRR